MHRAPNPRPRQQSKAAVLHVARWGLQPFQTGCTNPLVSAGHRTRHRAKHPRPLPKEDMRRGRGSNFLPDPSSASHSSWTKRQQRSRATRHRVARWGVSRSTSASAGRCRRSDTQEEAERKRRAQDEAESKRRAQEGAAPQLSCRRCQCGSGGGRGEAWWVGARSPSPQRHDTVS